MAERYSSVFRLPAELYSPGCPVIVAAGALLRDELYDRYVVQLKLRNIAPEALRSVTVEIAPRDAAGRPVGAPVLHTYPDLAVQRDDVFAHRTAVPVADREGRLRLADRVPAAFSVRVTEAVFADGRLWKGGEWPEPLPVQKSLAQALEDEETVRQYQLRFSPKSRSLPLKTADVWLCSCGAVNHEGEEVCFRCGQSRDGQFAMTRGELEQERDSRLALEEQRREELLDLQEKTLAETGAKARRIWGRALLIAALLAVLALGVYVGRTYLLPALAQRKAEQQVETADSSDPETGDEAADAAAEAPAARAEEPPAETVKLSAAQPGDVVIFGSFYINSDKEKDDIQWIVLERNFDELVLISRQALRSRQYHYNRNPVTWERCTLRLWLRDTFRIAAFSQEEQEKLCDSRLETDGAVTVDKIYLLSAEELEKYDPSLLTCAPSPRAEAEGCRAVKGFCPWWLRDGGRAQGMAKFVNNSGKIVDNGTIMYSSGVGVRPVIRVKIN